ncbi:hypothetical protein EVA_01190 [gut metagenome]|uniref:Uncharacterized protein n=1 Tax=gut metagenome TaxID=749906 RepID=J9H3B7_9ZZZZ
MIRILIYTLIFKEGSIHFCSCTIHLHASCSRIHEPRRGGSVLAQGRAKRNLGLNKRPFKYIRTPKGWKQMTTKGKRGPFDTDSLGLQPLRASILFKDRDHLPRVPLCSTLG